MALKNLKKFRKDNDMSQKEMASLLGMSQVNYSRYEKGQRNPDISILQKIVRRINVSGSFLLDYDETKHTVYISENADLSLDINLESLSLSPSQNKYLSKKILLLIADYKRRAEKNPAKKSEKKTEKKIEPKTKKTINKKSAKKKKQ